MTCISAETYNEINHREPSRRPIVVLTNWLLQYSCVRITDSHILLSVIPRRFKEQRYVGVSAKTLRIVIQGGLDNLPSIGISDTRSDTNMFKRGHSLTF